MQPRGDLSREDPIPLSDAFVNAAELYGRVVYEPPLRVHPRGSRIIRFPGLAEARSGH
jgi:hypothetical protein